MNMQLAQRRTFQKPSFMGSAYKIRINQPG